MPSVILVDDEIWALRALEALLADYPHYKIAATFTDGHEALDYLRAHPCDILFTDLRMGHMGGRQLIAACVHENIPVRTVIISAYSDFAAAREGLHSGVIDYLLKPVTREDVGALVARLDAALASRPAASDALFQAAAVYPECRTIVFRQYDAAAGAAVACVHPDGFSLQMGNAQQGFSVALLSNPLGKLPSAIAALPESVGISRPRENFSVFPDMFAEACQSLRCAFRFVEDPQVAGIQAYIAANYEKALTLDMLTAQFFMSKTYLCSIFHEKYGETVMTFLKSIRVNRAAFFLTETGESIQQIAQRVGYADSAYFSRVFKSVRGVSPEAYRKAGGPS